MKSLQALFGGTFDPVHYGHLKPVETLANLIGLTRVTIIPNNVPPHRPQPEANSVQRKHLSDLVRIRNDTRQCTFDRLSASRLPT